VCGKTQWIWKKNFGDIPKDNEGRSYEIHHLDGNHQNNNIDNLVCIPIAEHYQRHHERGDWGACVLIAKRMKMSPDFISEIQRGKKRPGIGGSKKGENRFRWNKGKRGYKLNVCRKGKRHSSKISTNTVNEIKERYKSEQMTTEYTPTISRNGKILSFERHFANIHANEYQLTSIAIYNIITGRSWNDNIHDIRRCSK
jgi:hypothetical protein